MLRVEWAPACRKCAFWRHKLHKSPSPTTQCYVGYICLVSVSSEAIKMCLFHVHPERCTWIARFRADRCDSMGELPGTCYQTFEAYSSFECTQGLANLHGTHIRLY